MKTADEVSLDKLRGGFYTPDALVQLCLDRLHERLPDLGDLSLFEPSAGDGAFIRGVTQHPVGSRISRVTAVELVASEAQKCRETEAQFDLAVHACSVLGHGPWSDKRYDAVVGNPPFLRFQFVPTTDQAYVAELASDLGLSFQGVQNLWTPVLLSALSLLRDGGAFALVVPAEMFTGISASVVRAWLLHECRDVSIDLFAPGSFPGVLQEVVVLAGQRFPGADASRATVRFRQHGLASAEWRHGGMADAKTWTRFLLTPRQVEALREASALPEVSALGELARFEVATVTGANDFFTVDDLTLKTFELGKWALPLLPRVRHAEGLTFTDCDYDRMRAAGLRAHLLDFSASRADPMVGRSAKYVRMGEDAGLPKRYKCRIRSPWHRVPVVAPGALLMSKRSHWHPRVIVNAAGVYTTDTIYRGRMVSDRVTADDLAASFHNSLTLLTAEVEGRSFAGGVLELVPSEVARLTVIVPALFGQELPRLDACLRTSGDDGQSLVEETDRLVTKHLRISPSTLEDIQAARLELLQRRIDRNSQ